MTLYERPRTMMMMGTANNLATTAMMTTTATSHTTEAPTTTTTMKMPPIQKQRQQQGEEQQQLPASPPQMPTPALTLASLEWLYFQVVSLYRRRNYEKCVEVCNVMLQAGHENNVQMFNSPPDEEEQHQHHQQQDQHYNNINSNVFGAGSGTSMGSVQRYGSNLQRNAPARQARRQSNHNNNNNTSAGTSHNNNNNNNNNKTCMPTWMMEGVWQLKMRALTQRVYIDDLETDDAADGEHELERIATAARPGTSIKTAFLPRPSTSNLRLRSAAARLPPGTSTSNVTTTSTGSRATLRSNESNRTTTGTTNIRTSISARPTSGMRRPGTNASRPGSSLGSRPASRCGTASRIRATSAAAFTVGDVTAKLYQASRLNPTIYAEREALIKALFQFLYYHESDVQKAYTLCEAVMEVHKQKRSSGTIRSSGAPVDWWWDQQMGRCLLVMRLPRKAEMYLVQSLAVFPHPDTYLLLSRLYQRLDQPARALELITMAVDRHPFDAVFRNEQGRIFDAMSKPDDAMQIYRLITKLNPIHIEALACIALNHFYENNPEMALMYYRRILSLGVHTPELYCNIALCCLYGGQIDLVLPCFQRALLMSRLAEQRADIWYNLSFVAISTGDFHLARRCLQLCLTADARNGAALNNLAVLAAHGGDLMRAKSYLQAAKEVLNDCSEIESNLQYMEAHYKL